MIIFTRWHINILVAYRTQQYITLLEEIFLNLNDDLLGFVRILKVKTNSYSDCKTIYIERKHFSENVQK